MKTDRLLVKGSMAVDPLNAALKDFDEFRSNDLEFPSAAPPIVDYSSEFKPRGAARRRPSDLPTYYEQQPRASRVSYAREQEQQQLAQMRQQPLQRETVPVISTADDFTCVTSRKPP